MQHTRTRMLAIAGLVAMVVGAYGFLRSRGDGGAEAGPSPSDQPAAVAAATAHAVDPTRDSLAAVVPPPPDTSGARGQAAAFAPPPDSAAATADPAASATPRVRYRAGEDPEFAARMGWPVTMPVALPGSLLPDRRIVAYYGNPLSRRMGVLGEYEPADMLRRLDAEVEKWNAADPDTPVQPALHLIAVVAQGEPGAAGKYRLIMRDSLIEQVYGWARSRNAILFIDLQVGLSDIRELLPRFDQFLARPDVHLGIDPEFMMKSGHRPGTRIGSMSAADINYAAGHLAELVKRHELPPKVLVIHRFTRNMVTGSRDIRLRPEVQIVINMDGWGAPFLKRDTYRDYIVREPVQYTGFKLFYHNDTKNGHPLMTPADVLRLRPVPLYIQYQ